MGYAQIFLRWICTAYRDVRKAWGEEGNEENLARSGGETSSTENIKRLLDQAIDAECDARIANTQCDFKAAKAAYYKRERFYAKATRVYLQNPDADWPDIHDVDLPVPERPSSARSSK